MPFKEEIVGLLKESPGLSDREITDRLRGRSEPQQAANSICRELSRTGVIVRRQRPDGILGNFLVQNAFNEASILPIQNVAAEVHQSEDRLKEILCEYLVSHGWVIKFLAMGKTRGVDIEAVRNEERWLIEVKGIGSRPAMRVNYFLAVIGELLCRMTDANAKYSIAIPDVPQFRGLWERFPEEAKSRTRMTALFVADNGIQELR